MSATRILAVIVSALSAIAWFTQAYAGHFSYMNVLSTRQHIIIKAFNSYIITIFRTHLLRARTKKQSLERCIFYECTTTDLSRARQYNQWVNNQTWKITPCVLPRSMRGAGRL